MWNRTRIFFMLGGSLLLLTSVQACQNQDFHSQDNHRTARLEPPPPLENIPATEKPELDVPAEDQPIFKNCDADLDRAIIADLYRLPPQTETLPDFLNLEPIKKVCLKQLDITDRDFTEGFPGVDDLVEWFALRMAFYIDVQQAGRYHFDLASDDGSKLFINEALLIDNDGQHAWQEKSASILLEPGLHTLTIEYFQGPRYRIAFEVFWTPPGQLERSYIPTNIMKRKPSPL
ncbi:MAG: PA14 domain-containing protein [Oligoflexus sp.]